MFTYSTQEEVVTAALFIMESQLKVPEVFLTSPQIARDFFTLKLRNREREFFAVAFLNNQHGLIAYEEMFAGSVSESAVYPRIVVQRALQLNACASVLIHNHPSGVSSASQADMRITERLVSALALIEVKVLDHLIIGSEEIFSFAEKGLL